MKKQVTLFLMAFLSLALNLQAKTLETTLWEGTYQDGIELNAATVATFKAGDVLRVYVTVPEGGASFKIVYKGAPDWSETTIPSIDNQWPWVNDNETYKEFILTNADITALSGKNIYIYKGNISSITKVTLTSEVPTTGETELQDTEITFTGSWEWDDFDAQTGAKVGDVIRLTYTAYDESSDWPYVQFNIKDSNNGDIVTFTGSKAKNSVNTYDFEITNATVLEKIQTGGFKITGTLFKLTSVKLLTYADSYDAVAITVGSDGIATYSNGNKNVQISACDALKAYYASAVAEGTVTLTELTCIPANQGAIVKGTADTYTVKVGGNGWEDLSSKNYLKPSNGGTIVAASTEGAYHYIFAKKGDETPAFYKLATAAHTLAAHKAYLETPTDIAPSVDGSRSITIDFGDGTTAIMDVLQDDVKQQLAQEDGVYYTLQGTRVQNPTKGLYILNGKKIIVK